MSIFLASHYTNPGYASIGHGHGFDTVPSAYLTEIRNDFLCADNNFNLNIGNSRVCTGSVVGR
ncbi:hypothetical protein [Burkholderia plantarii]|uniref:hypothetical protein n=1 Tax=Burkholderia plantarii TaxID=41899 RepID=UPI0018DB60AE|nr:hypothetical protein [Burkholderia plantarii]MBI0329113.1 hypothetical protein [Burkholderia plantarii]